MYKCDCGKEYKLYRHYTNHILKCIEATTSENNDLGEQSIELEDKVLVRLRKQYKIQDVIARVNAEREAIALGYTIKDLKG